MKARRNDRLQLHAYQIQVAIIRFLLLAIAIMMQLCGNSRSLFAQSYTNGVDRPKDESVGNYHLDTIHGILWARREGRWIEMMTGVDRKFEPCGDMVFLVGPNHCIVIASDGNDIAAYADCKCFGAVIKGFDFPVTRYVFSDVEIAQAWTEDNPDYISPWDTCTLQGILSFNASSFLKPYGFVNQEEVHSWGMLGINGAWTVEPIYDAPFHFENGVADVLYYSQKRKINEKGEFVE